MEYIISKKKKIIKKELLDEFYINPRDFVINGKFDSQFIYYLPQNDCIVFILDNNFTILDLKKSMIRSISIKFISSEYKYLTGDNKITDKKKKENYESLCFLDNNQHGLVKNFIVIEIENEIDYLLFVVEYMNNDFCISRYSLINNKFENVLSLRKLDENYFKVFEKMKKFQVLTYDSNLRYLYIGEIVFIFYRMLSNIFIGIYNTKLNSFNFFFSIEKMNLINFDVMFDNKLIWIFYITDNFNMIVESFSYTKKYSNFKLELKTSIDLFNDNKMISGYRLRKDYLFIAKLNTLYIFKRNDNSFTLFRDVNFQYLNIIKFIEYIDDRIYVFNSSGDYSTIEITETNTFVLNKFSMHLINEIYHIVNFKNGKGVYLIGAFNVIKSNDFTITYFIPNKYNLKMKDKHGLSEYVGSILRNRLEINIDKNDKFINRIYYYKYMFENNNESIKNLLLDEYKQNKSILKYMCEICDSLIKDDNFCINNHFTPSCCLTNIPVNINNTFLTCDICDLIFEKESLSKNNSLCVICQNRLNYL